MRRGGIIAASIAVFAAFVIWVPGALAATPQQIYRDYADNGRLDGHYSKADLKRALFNAVIQGYGAPTKSAVKPAIKKKISQGKVAGVNTPAVKKTGVLPFTGLDLALMTVGSLSLLLLGGALRRFARDKA
jgi:hypothetical protein